MAKFVNSNAGGFNNTNNSTSDGGGYQQRQSDREYIGSFMKRDGKYGTFYKSLIDDHEYYLTFSEKKDDNGNPYLILKKGGKVQPKSNG
jgi:hypothetical protein